MEIGKISNNKFKKKELVVRLGGSQMLRLPDGRIAAANPG